MLDHHAGTEVPAIPVQGCRLGYAIHTTAGLFLVLIYDPNDGFRVDESDRNQPLAIRF